MGYSMRLERSDTGPRKSYTKEVLAVLGLQSVCQMSRKKPEVVFPVQDSSENMFRLDEFIFGV